MFIVPALLLASCSTEEDEAALSSPADETAEDMQADGASGSDSSIGADDGQSESNDAEAEPCLLSVDEVQRTLAGWLGPGQVTIDREYSFGDRCTYQLPDGSFTQSAAGGVVVTGSDGPSLVIDHFAYAEEHYYEVGSYEVVREVGGTTATEVYQSASVAIRDVGAASGLGAVAQQYPDIGNGLITDNQSQFVLAGTRDHWYEGSLSGMRGDPAYNDTLIAVASLLSERG